MIIKCKKKTCRFNDGNDKCSKDEIIIKDFSVQYLDFAVCSEYEKKTDIEKI